MKKTLLLIFILALFIALPFTVFAETYSGTCGDNLTWSLDTATGELVISGTGEMDDYTRTTPWFSERKFIRTITVENGVTSIGDLAFFWCDNLVTVTISESVTRIGEEVFVDSGFLEMIEVDENNPNYCDVDGVLFDKAKTTLIQYPVGAMGSSYTIPDGVTSIGNHAFSCAYLLEHIIIPDSVTTIGDWAFNDCYFLMSVSIPDHATSIGKSAFSGCESFTTMFIPDSVTTIGDEAFSDCVNLANVTIGNGVKSIGSEAFYKCTSLTSITVGNSVTSVGKDAFAYCRNLTAVHITDLASWCGINFQMNAFYETTANPLSYADNLYLNGELVTDLVVPSSVTEIGNYAFYDYDNLTSVTILDGLTSIGDGAFKYCSALTSATIGNSVTRISIEAFNSCKSLTKVTIPNSVTSIDMRAFYSCPDLIVYGCQGSFAETYAIDNDLLFEYIFIPDITDYSLLLDGSIGLKFYMDIKGTSEAVAKFVYDNKEYDAEIEEENGKYFAVLYLSPKDMSKEVTLNLSTGAESDSVTVSIGDYIEYINKNSQEYTESLSLINAISDYNTYADAYFNEKTIEDVVLTNEEEIEIAEVVSPKLTSSKLNGLTFHSTSLILEDTTTIRHYFKIENLDTFNVSSYTVEGGTPLKVSGEYAYTDIENIPAHKLSEQKTVKVSDGQNESDITFSALNYVKLTYNKEDTRLSNLAKSIFRYSTESQKYNRRSQ